MLQRSVWSPHWSIFATAQTTTFIFKSILVTKKKSAVNFRSNLDVRHRRYLLRPLKDISIKKIVYMTIHSMVCFECNSISISLIYYLQIWCGKSNTMDSSTNEMTSKVYLEDTNLVISDANIVEKTGYIGDA